jgi:predicted RNase H-like HicB family nuclease
MRLCVRISQNERGEFVAACPSLPGCVTFGDTQEQAEKRLEEAIRGYIAAINNFVPERLDREVVVEA